MKQITKFLIILLVILAIVIPVSFAADLFTPFTVKEVYDGATPIKDIIDTKIINEVSAKGLGAKSVMEKQVYPYVIPTEVPIEEPKGGEEKVPVTVITIQKSRYDEPTQTMWYWIEATRDGKEVAVNNPIWVYPAPKDILISEVKDEIKNEVTITLKEDPKLAVEQVLQQYVDRQPIGKATVGTKE